MLANVVVVVVVVAPKPIPIDGLIAVLVPNPPNAGSEPWDVAAVAAGAAPNVSPVAGALKSNELGEKKICQLFHSTIYK